MIVDGTILVEQILGKLSTAISRVRQMIQRLLTKGRDLDAQTLL